MSRDALSGRLVAIDLDPESLGTSHALTEAERAAAIRDLIAENRFHLAGRSGSFRLRLSIVDGKLALDIHDSAGTPIVRHILSLTPLARVMKDYFMICESHRAAMREAPASRIEALDMTRRGIHNEGAEALRERLAGRVDVDFATARRLFTLISVLRWKG